MGILVLNNQAYSGNENNGHLYGEEIPRTEQGTEGSVYFQYTCTQAEDEEGQIIRIPNDIVCVYSKIDGQWIPWDEDDVPEVHGAYSVVIPNPPGPSDSGDLTKIKIDGSTFDVGGGGGTEVVANPSGEPGAQLRALQVGENIYSVETDVVANPQEGGGDPLTSLKVGNTVYSIPSDPDEILPNPVEEATGDLTKISFNGTVYDIPGTGSRVYPNPSGGSETNLLKISIDGTIYKVGDDYSKVEGNPSSGTVVGNLDSIKIDGDVYNIDNNVEANPVGTPTDTLTTISIDNTIYEIDGGNEVEANPSGTATDTLTTISVDGTIYDIPGTGTELPENYNPNQQYLRITSPDEYNELGWGVSNDTYYFDTAAEWYLGNRRTIKSNATPALGAIALVGSYYNNCLVSTNADATNHLVVNYTETKQHYSFEYKGHTWYWSGGEWGLPNASGSSGIQVLSGSYDSYETVAKYLIDQSEVYFNEYQDTFTQVGTPLSGHLFVGGGEESDYSDATFDVERDGTIHGKELKVSDDVKINNVSVLNNFTGATSSTAGAKGMVPAPLAGDDTKFLKGDGTWGVVEAGSGLPENWTTTEEYLRGTVKDLNELGWGVRNTTYYFDGQATWSYNGQTFIKTNSKPAIAALMRKNSNWFSLLVSTDSTAVTFNGSNSAITFRELYGLTWYYTYNSSGTGSLSNVQGIVNIGQFDTFIDAVVYLINASEIYTSEYTNKFAQISTPITGHLFTGGGSQANLSDATFDVESDGTVHATDFQIGNTSIVTPFTGATSLADGSSGMVPQPEAGDEDKFLKGDGTWAEGGGDDGGMELTYNEYLALSEEEKTNGTTYYVKDINGDGQEFQPIIYSTDEREIGVWTDGKPLYQTTFNFSSTISLASNTWVQIPNTFISNIDRGIKTICGYNHGNYNCIISDLNASPIELYNTRNFTIAFDTLTVQYTKTTDAPGSGTWTPQGVPAHHYSENELVVGTWVDGSTLYEKTFITPTINNTILNIDLGFAIGMGVVVHGYYLLNDAYGSMISANQWFASNNYSWTHIELNTHTLKCNLKGYTGIGYITIRYTKQTS